MKLTVEEHLLPVRIRKPIQNLLRSREKAEKHKKLLDFGEVLIIYLASVTLGEYKQSGITNVKFERSLKGASNLSVGRYIGIIRESLKALKSENISSVLEDLFPEKRGFKSDRIKLFDKSFNAIKKQIEKGEARPDFQQIIEQFDQPGQLNGKTSLADFFNAFVQIRNKTAHPIYMTKKGIQVQWPANEQYYDALNPLLEKAFEEVIRVLEPVWAFRQFKVLESDADTIVVGTDDDDDTTQEFDISAELETGVSILIREAGDFIVNDMRRNLKPGEEALRQMEEERKRQMRLSSTKELEEAVVQMLDDEIISVAELDFLQSLARNKLNMNEQQTKDFIREVANKQGIEHPFPDTEKFEIMVNDAMTSGNFNRLNLMLTAQNYGITDSEFEELLKERAEYLDVDLEELERNAVRSFSPEDMEDIKQFTAMAMWLRSLKVLRNEYPQTMKIGGQSEDDEDRYEFKKYMHSSFFEQNEKFYQKLLDRLGDEVGEEWVARSNRWQAGNMAGYQWIRMYPKNSEDNITLILAASTRLMGSHGTGISVDRKAAEKLTHPALYHHIYKKRLIDFFIKYEEEVNKIQKLKILKNNRSYYREYMNTMYDSGVFEDFVTYVSEWDEFYISEEFDEYLSNVGAPITDMETIFNVFRIIIKGVEEDYLIKSENYADPLEESKNQQENLLNKLNSFMSQRLDMEPERSEFHSSDTRGWLFQRRHRKISHGISYGFRLDENGTQPEFKLALFAEKHTEFKKSDRELLMPDSETKELDLSGDGENQFYDIIEAFAAEFECDHCFYFEGHYVVTMPVHDNWDDIQAKAEKVLDHFTTKALLENNEFLGFSAHIPWYEEHKEEANELIDKMTQEFAPVLKNKVRSFREEGLHLAYFDQTASRGNTFLYGLMFRGEEKQPHVGFRAILSDRNKYPKVERGLRKIVAEHPEECSVSVTQSGKSQKVKIIETLGEKRFKASTQRSKRFGPERISFNQNGAWSPGNDGNGEWVSVKFPYLMNIHELHIGSGKKHRVTEFNLQYRINKKDWKEWPNVLGGPETAAEPRVIRFDPPFVAQELKFEPKEWEHRSDFKCEAVASVVLPEPVELEWAIPVNADDLQSETVCENLIVKMREMIMKLAGEADREFGFNLD